uniref:Uncharacterized protein n=1 Tax=Arundo donax TaxID=35708 RepID=A0A0A9HDJ8_ARUDO
MGAAQLWTRRGHGRAWPQAGAAPRVSSGISCAATGSVSDGAGNLPRRRVEGAPAPTLEREWEGQGED